MYTRTIIAYQLTSIRAMFSQLAAMMSCQQQRQIRKYCVFPIFLFMALALANAVADVTEATRQGFNEYTSTLFPFARNWFYPLRMVMGALFIPYNCFWRRQWVVVATSLYGATLTSWAFALSNVKTYWLSAKQLTTTEAQSMIAMKHYLNDIKRTFDKTFNIIPLLFLGSIFVESTGMMVTLRDGGMPDTWRRITCYVANAVLTCVLLIIVIKVQSQEAESNEKVLRQCLPLLRNQSPNLCLELTNLLSKQCPLTAILFDLSPSLILTFISSLVTFTVLFAQLSY
ncbi:hypothetical protein HDE_00633 [Halotydeus destructor]|nr:hypothetical protein HDE_00633 [Halotydeus destructor]